VFSINDEIFPVMLKTLSDHSENVRLLPCFSISSKTLHKDNVLWLGGAPGLGAVGSDLGLCGRKLL